jgi:putative membrane protein
LLTADERVRIETAVAQAERRTSAEFVPMVVARSGIYRDAAYRGGLALAAASLAALLATESLWLPWGWHAHNAVILMSVTLMAYGIGGWLGRTTQGIRLLVPQERMRHKVHLRAERAFTEHGLGHTRQRTGVLVLISLLERQVSVYPDRLLHQRVPPEAWQAVVGAIVPHLAEERLADGFCAGIEHCGTMLAEYLPPPPGDNPDELPNRVIQE